MTHTDHDPLTERIIGCAIAVHRAIGPGLLESTYEEALCMELQDEVSFLLGRCCFAFGERSRAAEFSCSVGAAVVGHTGKRTGSQRLPYLAPCC